MATERKTRPASGLAAELRRARTRGDAEASDPMRAVTAGYDRGRGRVLVELANGCLFGFLPALVEDLGEADDSSLAAVSVEGGGTALRWDDLDVDLLVAPLLMGVFGTRTWMREMGRRGGSKTSRAKARAARANGRMGGRPRK
jgi:hypothetical protein